MPPIKELIKELRDKKTYHDEWGASAIALEIEEVKALLDEIERLQEYEWKYNSLAK